MMIVNAISNTGRRAPRRASDRSASTSAGEDRTEESARTKVRQWAGGLTVALVFVAGGQLTAILWLIWRRSSSAPYLDEWVTVRLLRQVEAGRLGFDDLWALHNEHRIVVPRLIDLGLIWLADWHRQVHMTAILGVSIVTLVLLVASVRLTLSSTITPMILAVPTALIVLSVGQLENWLQPFAMNFPTTAFGVALCVWALTSPKFGAVRLGVAILGIAIASLSTAAGLIAWLAFLPAIWRLGRWQFGVWIAAATSIIVPYAVGFPHRTGSR